MDIKRLVRITDDGIINAPSAEEKTPVEARKQFDIPVRGNQSAPIIVLCDAPKTEAYKRKLPTEVDNLTLVAKFASKHGLCKEDFLFVGLCPPIPEHIYASTKKKWEYVSSYSCQSYELIKSKNPKLVIAMGELAARTMLGRSVAITKARGALVEKDGMKIMPMLSPGYVNRIPEHMPIFEADILTVSELKKNNWELSDIGKTEVHYEWREDISDVLEMSPPIIAIDTETTGLDWYDEDTTVLTIQITYEAGQGIAIAIDPDYGNWRHRMRARSKLFNQIKQLLENPEVKKVAHNGKFDLLMLRKIGIEVKGYQDDTLQMAFAVDENMLSKGLDDCVRRWVPEMAGYSDFFDQTVDKSRMREVPHDKMLPYALGDSDAVFRLRQVLDKELKKDFQQYRCYRRIMIPGILAFCNYVERFGMLVDQDNLRAFGAEVNAWLDNEYRELIQLVPPKVRIKHLNEGKELKFSRADFVRDALFTKDGFNLKPLVFTKTTASLSAEERVPSTSTKDHLPYFIERGDAAGDFVLKLIEYQKTEKLLTTYIGHEADLGKKKRDAEDTGLWQYIANDGRIYPSYLLHGTNTGRSSSKNPNGQNFPVRGKFAKPYQKIFKPTPGYKIVKCDLSQIELRLVAWASGDPVMQRIYREGGDIHAATARAVSGLNMEQWAALPSKERKLLRFKAKACIAEGQKVLTKDRGLVPIEKVQITDLLWDGIEWVEHEGVIYKGYKEVITYDGLKATKDHKVYTDNGPIQIGRLASSVRKQRIAIGAVGEIPVRYTGPDRSSREARKKQKIRRSGMFSLPREKNDLDRQYQGRQDKGMYVPAGNKVRGRSASTGIRRKIRRDKTAMLHFYTPRLPELWGAWGRVALRVKRALYTLDARAFTSRKLQKNRYRSRGQQRALRAGESAFIYQSAEFKQQKANGNGRLLRRDNPVILSVRKDNDRFSEFLVKENNGFKLRIIKKAQYAARGSVAARRGDRRANSSKEFSHVYDIVNAGPRHRFTVGGKVVANCNFGFVYGMWWKKFMVYAKTQYGVTYTEKEAALTRERFFSLYKTLPAWHDKAKGFARKHGYIRALHGAVRHLPSIFSNDEAVRQMAERQAVNAPIQRLGSDLGMMAIIRFAMQADPELFRVIGFIHDAIVMEVKEGYEKEGTESLLWCMGSPPIEKWFGISSPIPICADAEIGINGGETLEFADLPPVEERPQWFVDMGFDTVTPTKPAWWDEAKEEQFYQQFIYNS